MEVKIERTDAPVTRYDEMQRSCYSIAGSKTPSLDRSGVEPVETKVYSSSYPGTTSSLSTESGGNEEGVLEPGGSVLVIDTGSSREEMILSHDDLSHDSYELLEREDLYAESRSCSIDSTGDQMLDDEMFVMDDDFSGHNGSGEVEKRLGYVEPRFGDLDFKEFNEKCKQGFAYRRAVEFGEFDAKCKPGMVIGFDDEINQGSLMHYPVERTKSDPYVSDFWRVARQHRARLLHQKSIDLTPTEPSIDPSSYLGDDMKSSSLDIPCGSKSAVDIPYTLHKRHHMNGTESISPLLLSPHKLSPISGRRSPVKLPGTAPKDISKPKKTPVDLDPLTKTKSKPDLNSQDSGLSLSVGTESADDLHDVLLKNVANFDQTKDVEEDIQLKQAVDEIISESLAARRKAEKLELEKEKVPKMVSREVSTENEVNTNLLQVPDDTVLRPKTNKKEFVKGKSEDTKSKKGSLSKSRQVHSADGGLRKDSSFEKRDSAVKVIKIDSDDGLCHCDKKDRLKSSSLDSSDPDVIIVEYRGNRKRAFQKRSSSGSKGSKDSVDKDIKRSSSLDAPKDGKDKKDSKSEKGKDGRLIRSKSDGKDDKKKTKPDQKKPIRKDEPKFEKNEIQVEVEIETNRRSNPTNDSSKPVDINKPKIPVKPQIPTKPLKLTSGESKVQSANEKPLKTPDKPPRSFDKPVVPDKPQKLPDKPKEFQSNNVEKPKADDKTLQTNERKEKIPSPNTDAALKSANNSGLSNRDFKDLNLKQKDEKPDTKKTITSPDTSWKKFGDLPAPISHKRERSPVLFARLGLSEGSAYSPTHRQSSVTSPSSSRRCKSLDAPVVSLHRLPPVTSFSSKDDTLDNEEDVELEEKALRTYKSGKGSNVCLQDSIIEERSPEGKETPDDERQNEPPSESNFKVPNLEKLEGGELSKEIKTQGKNQDDITVTLEKLDEVVDRVKAGDSLQEENLLPTNTVQSGHSKVSLPPLSPITDRACSPIMDLPPSPFKSPMSPSSRTPGALSPAPLSPSPLSPTPSSPKPPLSPTIIEPPMSPSAERRPSTRQERLDSFKNTKSYSVDIWTSDEGENQPVPTMEIEDIDFTSKDYEDETFIIEKEDEPDVSSTKVEDVKLVESGGSDIMEDHQESPKHAAEVVSTTEDECWVSVEDIRQIGEDSEPGEVKSSDNQDNEDKTDRSDSLKVELDENTDVSKVLIVKDSEKLERTIKDFMEVIEPLEEPSTSGIRMIPEKRSFDDEPSSSSSIKQVELSSTWKPFPLESSGSSSLEEAIFPPDDTGHYADEEEGSSHSNGQDDFPSGFGYSMTGAEMIISGYTGGMFGLSRTLSRISERSTTSEQERSDFEDDISTKPSSRSLSVDDESLLSSDRQPSLSSDPPSGPNPEDQPLPDLPPLPKEPDDVEEDDTLEGKLGFKIPPPLLPVGEDEWPSPPNSSPFDTPVVSHVETFYMEIKPEEATKVVVDSAEMDNEAEAESDTDENKTLQEEFTGFDESSVQDETTVKLAKRPKTSSGMYANSASEDTSVGVSDFSSSTSTVKHCQYYSCAVKSDDSSLAGDFGLSLSTEMLSSRKSSADSVDTFQQKRGSGIFKVSQRSFDDYDSPYSESDDGQSKPPPKQRMAHHTYYSNVSSPTSTTAPKQKVERSKFSRSGLKTPYYSTPTPVSHEHRDVSELLERRDRDRERSSKSIARSKCYSYYSLARSPPSDGSSSSLDNPEPPSTPNTIPRVSKRKRHIPPAKRRHRVSVDMEVRDGHIVSVSSPSVVACGRNRHPNSSHRDLQVIDPARQHSSNLSKQSSV
ncbi:uncharacterized protein LOC128993354 [Macrosteles quadrilineatus]|uniref:uncharacterized protein LOC128993354 n=1 Tax=Macrosteles quadrilineatus TaxID=74068 RepID=UPI0023E1762C|nr:uncharacterized protein LOC128993354 [Macrosteles quadrilineatus]